MLGIKNVKGGVLFIDEAYALSPEDASNDYGKEAIDTLVKGMEDYRDDLVVIEAGYVEEMIEFIAMNPGLPSRFNKYIHFENYSAQEMLDIFKLSCDKNRFVLSAEAEEAALAFLKAMRGMPPLATPEVSAISLTEWLPIRQPGSCRSPTLPSRSL